MSLKSYARAAGQVALALALAAGLSANKGCDQKGVTAAYVVERVPDEYRACFDRIVNVKDYEHGGKISWPDAQRLIVALKANNNELRRCGKGAIAWADAQAAALNRYLGS